MFISIDNSEHFFEDVLNNGVLVFTANSESPTTCPVSNVWAKALCGDRLVGLSSIQGAEEFNIFIYSVSDKGLVFDKAQYRACLSIDKVEKYRINKLPLHLMQLLSSVGKIIKEDFFEQIINHKNCTKLDAVLNKATSQKYLSNFEYNDYICSVEKYLNEKSILDSLLRRHKYGKCDYIIRVTAYRNEQIVGAALLDFNKDRHVSEAAQIGFGAKGYEFLKHNFIVLRRMVVCPDKSISKFRTQEALVRTASVVADALSEKQIKILAGNSYDYQPALIKEGFVCEIPINHNHALFYWLPISGFVDFIRDRKKMKNKVKVYLKKRKAKEG